MAVVLLPAASQAHTIGLCWKDDGAVTTFYAGTYHDPSEGPSPIGQIIVDDFGYPFSGYVITLPPDVDGCNYCDGWNASGAVHWQTFTSGFENASHTITFDSSSVVQSPYCAFPAATFGGGACADADFDGICNDVDACPLDFDNDGDADGVCGDVDNCPNVYNPTQDPSACAGEVCGNGTTEGSEECDDGNIAGGDGCSAICTIETVASVCGNGTTESGETCDDGNSVSGDCCSDTCQTDSDGTACDDGTFCNGTDTCASGACSHAGDPCSGGAECADNCNEGADNCFEAASTPCSSDANLCTDDVCNGAGSCGVNNILPCDDGVFCNGTDVCGSGACNHSGDPCPGTACNTCQEGTDTCFDVNDTVCTSDEDDCTRDRCNGTGTCTHLPIPLAETCNFSVVGGTNSLQARVRTRLETILDDDVCGDSGIIGEASLSVGSSSWALLRATGNSGKVRPFAILEQGSVVTGGGCLKGAQGAYVFGTDSKKICCTDGEISLINGGTINTCNESPLLAECATAKGQVAVDKNMLDGLPATQDLGSMECSDTLPCSINANGALSVIDARRISLTNEATLTIDALGNPDAVFIVRVARGLRSRLRGSFVLAGGAQASNVLFYVQSGKCDLGKENIGAGTIFCPASKARMRLSTAWEGAIAGGLGVDLGDYVVLTHVPFLGLAD